MFDLRLLFGLMFSLLLLAPIQAQEALHYNQVSLQATVEKEIVPDVMRITLYSEGRDKDAAKLASATTQTINAAIAKARQVSTVTIQSGNRHTYPTQDKKTIIWQERAELHLESSDFAALAALSTELMQDLKISSQSFLISKPRQKEIGDLLLEEAIAAFGARAQLSVRALGGQSYKIISLNLDDGGRPFPLMRARNMEMFMAQPASSTTMSQSEARPQIEAGTHEVVVTIQGLIEVEM